MWQKWAVLVSLMTFRVVANSTEASVGSRQDKGKLKSGLLNLTHKPKILLKLNNMLNM